MTALAAYAFAAGLLGSLALLVWLFHDYEAERPTYDEHGRAVR